MTAATMWMARDLPRRLVQAMAADLLQGPVKLDGFRIEPWHKLELLGLEVGAPATLPMVERAAFDRVTIEGTLEELLVGRIEHLTLSGMKAHLITSVELEEGTGHEISIGELTIQPATVTARGKNGRTTSWNLDGSLREVFGESGGEDTSGTVHVVSPSLELSPVLELLGLWLPDVTTVSALGTGTLKAFAADLELGDTPRASLRATQGEIKSEDLMLTLDDLAIQSQPEDDNGFALIVTTSGTRVADDSRELDLGPVQWTATVVPVADAPSLLRIDLDAKLEALDEAKLTAAWNQMTRQLTGAEGKISGFDLSHLRGEFRAEGQADLEFHGEGTDLVLEATVRPRTLELGSTSLSSARSLLTVTSRVPFENLTTTPPKLEGVLQANLVLPTATGALAGWELPAVAFPAKVEFDGKIVDSGDESPILQGTWEWTPAATGRLSATGTLNPRDPVTTDLGWAWEGSEIGPLTRLLEQAGLLDNSNQLPASGQLSGRGRLSGSLMDPEIHAELALNDGTIQLTDEPWLLREAEAKIEIDWWPHPRSPEIRIDEATAALHHPKWEPVPVTLRATAPTARDLRSGTVKETMVEILNLGRIEVAGSWRREPGRIEAEGTVHGRELDLAGWQNVLRIETADLAFKGLAQADLEGALTGDRWKLHGPVRLEGLGFSSTDGGRVLEGLAADWTVDVAGGQGPILATGSGTSNGFLVLWDTFFADLSNLEAQWNLDANADLRDESWRLKAEVTVPEGPVIEGELQRPTKSRGALAYTLDVHVEDLEQTHERYLQTILDERFKKPQLGGELRASLHGTVDLEAGTSLAGSLSLENLLWNPGEALALTGFDLELPLDLRFGSSGGKRLRGRMSFDRLSFRDLRLPPTQTGLWIENDGLELEEPLSFEILGGSITLGSLRLGDLFEPDRYLESSLNLTGLSLGKISEALGLFPLEGTIEGRLPSVQLSADSLQVEGGGEIGLFGGTVTVKDISGKEILTPFPSLTLSAEFDGIDLGLLTNRIDFGEMTGILRGSITDCELFRSVPVRCSAYFETVEQPGVSRTVDVKAINNLSILGTGAGTNVFDRGLQRFLDRYRYERLSVEVRLDNDVLLLKGMKGRGEEELFMKGRFPFPIDIVNVQPGRTVSFQAMMRRLQNLDFSAATTKPK